MIKQTHFLVHRGINIPAAAIIICGHCEMPIWRMTAYLTHLRMYPGYHGIPKRFITRLDGSAPTRPLLFDKGEPCWECPECGKYIVKNTGVFFEMHPAFSTWNVDLDATFEHKLRFFIDYEGIRRDPNVQNRT